MTRVKGGWGWGGGYLHLYCCERQGNCELRQQALWHLKATSINQVGFWV